ncbi:hypothetical protein MASR2M70_21840 [Bacillota bacterium]
MNIVANDPFASQRQISRQTGISLGQVNFLMKKYVAKGLLKIEGQTSKSIQYHLTPSGMAAVAEKTLRYMKNSYTAVREMTSRIIEIGCYYSEKGFTIHVTGSRDEMMELCQLALNDGKISYKVGSPTEAGPDAAIFCWEQTIEDQYADYTCVNLLKEQR